MEIYVFRLFCSLNLKSLGKTEHIVLDKYSVSWRNGYEIAGLLLFFK